MRCFAFVFVSMMALFVTASAQVVTWVKPSADKASPGLHIESAAPGVGLTVVQADTGQPAAKLDALGWRFETHELGSMLLAGGEGRGDTQPVRLTISRLPPGSHRVFLRYWAAAPGSDQQWYVFYAGLGDATRKWLDWDWGAKTQKALVAGLGGQSGGVFELLLGSVGTEAAPTAEVTVTFDRYIWGRIARLAAIRVETAPDTETPRTAAAGLDDETRAIRDTLLGFGPPDTEGRPSYGLGVVSGMVKVRPKSFSALRGLPLVKAVELSGAKGEWVNSQIVLFSPERDLPIAQLKASPLAHTVTGVALPADRVAITPVGFLFNDLPYEVDTHGWWPEPILEFLREFTIRQGDLQPLWVRVRIPRDAAPGTYAGHLTVTPDGAPATTVPIQVTVLDFALPERFTLRTAFGTGPLDLYPGFLLDYGINPGSIYRGEPPTREALARWATDGRVNAFNIRYIWRKDMDPNTGMPRPGDLDNWLAQIDQCLKDAAEVGLADRAYLYLFDEADGEQLAAIKAVAGAIRERHPDLLVLTTAKLVYGTEDAVPAIDGWVPRLGKGTYKGRQAEWARGLGKQLWWYVCNTPRHPLPNLTVLEPGINHRLLVGFMAHAYRMDGFLYYAMTGGWGQKPPPVTGGPYVRTHWTVRDRGDGNLCQLGPSGPLPSIRLELFRDGLEDYEYLVMVKRLADGLEGKALTDELTTQLRQVLPYLALGNGVVRADNDFTRAPAVLERARRQLADFIVAAETLSRTKHD